MNSHLKSLTLFLALLFTASTTGISAQVSDEGQRDAQSIEQAQTALKQAQSALEAAQDTLTQAQEVEAPPTQKAQATKKSKPGASRLYKWVDENGNISYQDSPPPKDVNVLDSDVLKESKVGNQPVKEVSRAALPEPVLDGSTPVLVYTADNCKPCQSVVLFLTQKQVPFIERDIRSDRNARSRLSKLSKQISVPTLFIGEQVVQGPARSQ